MRRRAVLLLLVVAALLVPAAPAWAHAQLQSTTPAPGARVKTVPANITLHFSEAVEVSPQAVQVFDSRGRRVDAGAARHPAAGASWVVATLRPGLPDGTYAVGWRAVSADTHPVNGGFTFVVGTGALGRVSAPASAGGSDPAVDLVYAIARWVVYGGLALLVGGVVFLLLCWPGGRVDARARRLLWGGFGAVSVASVLALALQGPNTRGGGLLDALTSRSLGETVVTRFGTVLSVRLVLLGLAALWLTALMPRWRPALDPTPPDAAPLSPAALATGPVLALGLLTTWPATGHASAGTQVALAAPVDVVHLAAMSVWLGGLAFLSLTLLTAHRGGDLARALPAFSRLAFSSVVVLVVTGVYQSWRSVGTLPAFTGTEYGRLLLLKLVAFVALVALGNLGRVFVRRHYDGSPAAGAALEVEASQPALVGASRGGRTGSAVGPAPAEREPLGGAADDRAVGRLRLSLLVEVVLGAVILALTALLAHTAPARDTYHPPAHATLRIAAATVRLDVTPARAGQDRVELRVLDRGGRPLDVPEVRAALSLPDRHVNNLPVPLTRAGPGHYVAPAADFPFAGRWQLAVTVRTSAFDEVTATTTLRIR